MDPSISQDRSDMSNRRDLETILNNQPIVDEIL